MENDMYFENEEQIAPKKIIRRRKKQLYSAIRDRMEFYFSDANLQKDRYLSQLLKNNPEIDLEVFMKFNKILQLTSNIQDLVKALKKSEMLQLSEDKTRVYRITPIKEKTNADACTIYVEQLSCHADHDWLKEIFSKFGKVDYISIPKYKASGKIKGFAFVEFETPEIAANVLQEFEKAGCCLTNQMNPEQLCSIATYEDEKSENTFQYGSTTLGISNNVAESENENIKSRKRKMSDNVIVNSDAKVKKIKKSSSEENIAINTNNKNEEKESNAMESQEKEHQTYEIVEEPAGVKKKKNRKKKKSHKTKYVQDIQSYGLQVLSKADWKKLRNKYLNIQKEKMKKLKQHLYRSQIIHSQRQHQISLPQSKPRFEFKSGVVVKVTLDEPLEDTNEIMQYKCHAKSFNNVEYVDISRGNTDFFIRFSNENAVKELMKLKPWDHMSVLEGVEEEEYWEKMKRDRTDKFENRKKFNSKRGRNKLINKAEKLISKRIRLSVDE